MVTSLDPRFWAFVAVAALLIVTPGPDTALLIRNSLRAGARAGSFSALGVGAGSLAWGAASVLGIAFLLESSAVAFTLLKLAGAAYLVFLGVRTLRDSLRSRGQSAPVAARVAEQPSPMRDRTAFASGLTNNLLNPKAGVIFLSVFPQFLRPGDSPLRLVLMMLCFEVMIVGWLALYGLVLDRVGHSHPARRVRLALERVTGAVIVGLGVRVALDTR